jgi:hypothetical protein
MGQKNLQARIVVVHQKSATDVHDAPSCLPAPEPLVCAQARLRVNSLTAST